jgi:peptidylprolyl isomerase
MTRVRTGDRVRVHVTERLPGGEVLSASRRRRPAKFLAGGEDILPGLAEAVLGMGAGEVRTVTVPPEKGFGEWDPSRERRVARVDLPPDTAVRDSVLVQGAVGREVVWVRELGEDEAVVDGNHPLAGITLVFDLVLVSFDQP